MTAEILGIAALSLRVALLATAIACAAGMPLGIWLGITRFRGRRFLLLLLNSALAVPTVVIGLTLYLLLSRRGPLGFLGFLYTERAIVLAELILALPIAAALTAAAVQSVDPRVHRTALTLGAGPLRAAWAVAREARAALGVVAAVAFGRVLSEVGAVLIVGGNIRYETRTFTTAIALATSQGQFAFALALGGMLLALALAVNVVAMGMKGRRG